MTGERSSTDPNVALGGHRSVGAELQQNMREVLRYGNRWLKFCQTKYLKTQQIVLQRDWAKTENERLLRQLKSKTEYMQITDSAAAGRPYSRHRKLPRLTTRTLETANE